MTSRHLVATTLYRELPEQVVPAIDEVAFLEGPGPRTPPGHEGLECDAELIEAEIPQAGLGFVVGKGEASVSRTYSAETGEWREVD